MTADGYTSNPPSGGGGGGPIAIGDVTGLTAALAAKLPIAGGTVTGALVVNGVLQVGTSVTLQIGADTNLYRVSANRLATDDSLDVGGDLLVYGNVDLQGTITGVAISDVSGLQAALDGKADDADVTALDARLDTLELSSPVVMSWNGSAYVADADARLYVGPGDPGSVPDGSIWIDTTP